MGMFSLKGAPFRQNEAMFSPLEKGSSFGIALRTPTTVLGLSPAPPHGEHSKTVEPRHYATPKSVESRTAQ